MQFERQPKIALDGRQPVVLLLEDAVELKAEEDLRAENQQAAFARDTYVAAGRALQSDAAAIALAVAAIILLLGFWYAYPAWRRMHT